MNLIDLSSHCLVFCKDSTLRFEGSFKGKPVLYPLEETLAYYGKRNSFFLRVLNNAVKIEKGATVSNIILALMPWADLIEDLTDRNIRNYAKACRKLSTSEQYYDKIVLSNNLAISRRCNLTDDNRLEYDDDFESGRVPSMCGFLSDSNEDNCDLSGGLLFDQIKNTPVFMKYRYEASIYHNNDDVEISCEGMSVEGKNIVFMSDDDISLNDFIQAFFVFGLYRKDPNDENSIDNITTLNIDDIVEKKSGLSLASSDGELINDDRVRDALSSLSERLDDIVVDDADYYDGLFEDRDVNEKILIGEVEYSDFDND